MILSAIPPARAASAVLRARHQPTDASGPPSGTDAPAPPGPPPQGQDGFMSCEDDEDAPIDWSVIAELASIFAPFSDLDTSEDPPASSPHGASSCTPPQMTHQAILQAYDNMLDQDNSPPPATPSRQEFLSDDFPRTALAPPAKRKQPAFVMGRRGCGMNPQNQN